MIVSVAMSNGTSIQGVTDVEEEDFGEVLTGQEFLFLSVPSYVSDRKMSCLIRTEHIVGVQYPLEEDHFWESVKHNRIAVQMQEEQHKASLLAQQRPAPGLHL